MKTEPIKYKILFKRTEASLQKRFILMQEKIMCLAFIWPAEDIVGKEVCRSNVKFISGPFRHKVIQYDMTTDIYKYYYWGVTFEVVIINQKGDLIEVRDIDKNDFGIFDLDFITALTYNANTHEILATNGFVYKLDQSLFYRHCPAVCEYIYKEMETANNFILYMYTINGGIASVLFDKDLHIKDKRYKSVIHKGFITSDNHLLRNMVPKDTVDEEIGEKLKQEDIDKLIEKMLKQLG